MPGAGNPQTLNRYSYVLNNPLRYTDPSGRIPVDASGQPLVSPGQYIPPSYISLGVAYLEALVALEEFKRGRLDFLEGPIKEGLSLLPGLGESEDLANVFGCSWVEERCGLPFWRQAAGGVSFFIPVISAGFLSRRADDAAALLRANRERGLIAERILGVRETKQALREGSRRILPDMFDLDLGVLAEVKNVRYLSNTLQLRTYAEFARKRDWTFVLLIRQDTVLSGPLNQLITESKGNIQVFRVHGLP